MSGIAIYAANRPRLHEDLVEQHAPLVKRIACHLINRLPASVQLEDLIQAGMIGLLEASRNYDKTQGASFETYAGIRIRGSMLDEIRKNDWAPRSVHRKARMVAEAVREIENDRGRDARDVEIAESLEMSLEDYYKILQDNSYHKVLSFEDMGTGEDSMLDNMSDNTPGIVDGLQNEDVQRVVSEAIASLPERERLVMALYYDEELNLREIGAIMGVSESRVSQIHSQAVIRLQARMASRFKDA
ncbi:RNA polymerase sigma factor FliA [Thiohalophilus thiocyanatoxydans]|uniref:RNA polymerase sigma factor FliA n=1 Tax=Thiohalophilus thiocyanatoxydans TaxID=381308 RepID=A0A4R8IHB9_9GAMM|nr:RNA polymerase sigma factor FliA [Thiohalophilus thiocyanatoxydans]TDY00006.1 RNA polymerase sigma-28 (SigD/FliA/WhiG) subunit [Thiohalophilus thiocyanatoxydans]